MSFGEKGIEQKHWSQDNFEIAVARLQEREPKFGEDTKEENNKYFVMGLEVLKPEYELFMEKVSALYRKVIEEYQNKLNKAA